MQANCKQVFAILFLQRYTDIRKAGQTRRGGDNVEIAETIRQNLLDAGCDDQQTAQFLTCWRAGQRQAEQELLDAQRCCLLDTLHKIQRQIDCLDYLVYQLRRETAD